MTNKLLVAAVLKFLLGVLLVGLLVFLPAGTLAFSGGWLLMGVLFVPMLFVGIVLIFRNPDLLQKRLSAKESDRAQQRVVKLSGLMFLAGFVIAGLDYRFAWLPLPAAIHYVGAALFLLSYVFYGLVLRQNAYLSRTIEIQDGQKVVDTGLYGIVRHPMYSATLVLFLSMPLVLGSLISFLIFLFYPLIIIGRIKNEERFLEENLDGYREYKAKVKYRLIPYIW